MPKSPWDEPAPARSARRVGSFFSQEMLRGLGMPEDLRLLPQISEAWRRAIGEPLCHHVQPTRYMRGQLSLNADSSTWASRIRHQQQGLIQRLRELPFFRQLVSLQVRIVPPGEGRRRAKSPAPANPLSAANRKLLDQIAQDVSDPALREALGRLGRNRR